jgi:hypothetical protein
MGAIAVIVVNNVAGEIVMSGADESITIPAISESVHRESIINQMETSLNVKIQLDSAAFVNSDGDFDNGIIAHEYGHGISTVCQVVNNLAV